MMARLSILFLVLLATACTTANTQWLPSGTFSLASSVVSDDIRFNATYDAVTESVLVSRDDKPLLRYAHGSTPVPDGIEPGFQRGDYVFALYGPHGEQMLDDYPHDHTHHRGINWAWATVKWKGETRDAFWVKGLWSRPKGEPSIESNRTNAQIHAESLWMWDDKTPIVREEIAIRLYGDIGPFPDGYSSPSGYFVDFDLRFTPLVDDLEFCGRLEEGYSGFNLRMARAPEQEIVLHRDPISAMPRRAWADYSAEFPGGAGRSGVTLLQHIDNPLYPSKWRKYEALNFFQPLYPGGQPILMPKGETIRLRYRLWVHTGGTPDEETLNALWTDFNSH